MVSFRRILRGAAWNWMGFVVTAAVAFFLSPYIVRHLGNVAYGVWVLVNAAVSYLGLLDLGMRGTVVRFVATNAPKGLHKEASRAVSAALWFRIIVAGIILIVSGLLAYFVGRAFRIPPQMTTPARWAILISGTNIAISLTFSVFSGVLNGMHLFDKISGVAVVQSLLTAAGIYTVIRTGHGIVAMALIQLTMTIGASFFLLRFAFRAYPELDLSIQLPEKRVLRDLWGYSIALFAIAISGRIIYYTDNLVIAAFLPISAVTFYAIGGNLVEYLREILSSLAVTFLPAASNLDAPEHRQQLQRLTIQGTRAVLLVALPIETALYMRGPTFIRLWMGPEYGEPSGHVLRVLLLAWFFIAANFCNGNIAYGLAKHGRVAIWTGFEAVANLALSIFLVRRIGSIGVAWGTVFPSVIINGILWPRYISSLTELRTGTYIWQSWIKPALAVIPFAAACYFAEIYWPARNLAEFFFQIVVLLPLMLLGIVVSFRDEAMVQLKRGTHWLAAYVRV